MTEKDDRIEQGELPRQLLLKFQQPSIADLWPDEIETLKSCLDTDPRTEVLLLRAMEFSLENEFFPGAILPLLAKKRGSGPLGLLLRAGSCRTIGKRGDFTLWAMQYLEELGEGDRFRRWFFLKTVGMDQFDLRYRDDMIGSDISRDAFDWIYQRAFECPELVPLLFADGKRISEGKWNRRKELLNILARQDEVFLQDYDLGELSEPLQELRSSLKGVSDPAEKKRLCELKLGLGEFAPPTGVPRPDLGPEEVKVHQQMAEDDQKIAWNSALAELCLRTEPAPEFNQWLIERLDRTGPITGSWARVIAFHARDFDVARKAMQHLLEFPDRRILAANVARFCGGRGPWKLPPEEGEALIRRALTVDLQEESWETSDSVDLWLLMIRQYGDHVQDFSDLLCLVEEGYFDGRRAEDLLRALCEAGINRDEIRQIVERRFQPPYESSLPPGNRLNALSLLKVAESPMAWELWMKAAEEWPDSGRLEAINLLAEKDARHPGFIALLQRLAHKEEDPLHANARQLLAIHSPEDFRAGEATLPEIAGATAGYSDPPAEFDAEGFRRWQGQAGERRQRRMAGVMERSDFWTREASAFSLAYWFGDHPDTLPFLIACVRRPIGDSPMGQRAFEKTRSSDEEHLFRRHCLRVIACRWPADPRVHELAKWALEHPWKILRDEAAGILARDFASAPDTVALLERQIGSSDVVFEEYVALMHRDLGGMRKGLEALAALGDSEWTYLLADGPRLLARAYGPRKDLKAALEKLARETSSQKQRDSIEHLLKELW